MQVTLLYWFTWLETCNLARIYWKAHAAFFFFFQIRWNPLAPKPLSEKRCSVEVSFRKHIQKNLTEQQKAWVLSFSQIQTTFMGFKSGAPYTTKILKITSHTVNCEQWKETLKMILTWFTIVFVSDSPKKLKFRLAAFKKRLQQTTLGSSFPCM